MLVIVEGTAGAGKTTLIRAVQAMRPEVRVLAAARADAVASLVDRASDAVLAAAGMPVLADTLHVTAYVRAGSIAPADFEELDTRVAALGARTVFVRVAEDVLIERLLARTDPEFLRDAARFGATDRAIARYFAAEQDRIAAALAQSRIPMMELDGTLPPYALAAQLAAQL